MAGLVVAFAVLKEVLSNLKSLVLNEFWLLWGVKKEKDKLESYMETIEAVLQDAETRQVKEMAVKIWLRKIKAAAHDAEDVLDEFRIEALRRKVENQAASMREKVGKLFYPPAFRFKMAHKMQKLRKNFGHIAKERSLFSFTERVVVIQPPNSRPRETSSAIVSKEVYGRDTEKADLIDLLIKSESENEEDLSVIPIVGMGGVGKTTLAQLVYNDEQVVNHFKELRMWVYVSENFDVGKLLKEILESATKKKADQLSMELLQTHLQNVLSGKRYLLVLDDVWNDKANEWYRLKALLTCGANGSKLLVTTRHDAVAKIMHAVPRPRLGILSNEDSWNLFQKLANPPPMCVAIGQEMVEKCGGLPLAITTLGGLMSSKETVSEWESVRDTSNLWRPQDSDGEILPVLQLSYDHLTPSLKQCFAYCAVIPKGRSFVKHELIKQWIALGFIHSDEENKLLEEKAEGYFNQLLQRSLFQGPYFNYLKEEYYTMHDLIHDLVKFVGEKECFIVKASMDTVPKVLRLWWSVPTIRSIYCVPLPPLVFERSSWVELPLSLPQHQHMHLPQILKFSKTSPVAMDSKDKRHREPWLDRLDYDAVSSSSLDSSTSSTLRTRSLDLPPSYAGQTSFRVEGVEEGEFERICQSFAFSGPEHFEIPAAVWEARKARCSSDVFPISRLQESSIPNSNPAAVDVEVINGAVVETDLLTGSSSFSTSNGRFRRSISSWTRGEDLGSGSFGTVYEGLSEDGFFFAVKEVSLLDQGSQAQQCIQQLEQEIALLSQFEHENIVRYLGTDKEEAKLYIFLELVTKGSLANLYQKYNLRDTQVSAYTRQILNGLKYLHDRGVLHRDIKCGNILVDASGSVKLADFGLAKETSKLNKLKSCRGSVYWMAPEVVNPRMTYGLAADIWSLGCSVLEMLTRQPPYYPLEWAPAFFQIGQSIPPPIPNSLSSDAQDFIRQCLRVVPDDRPSASKLLEHPFVRRAMPASVGSGSSSNSDARA